jgi:hypothetical protein
VESDALRFSEVADALAELGMPSALSNRLRAARSDDDVLDALSEMPEQWSTTALELYEISDVLVPTARYTLLTDAADLEDALANNNRAWDLYLHPSQRHIVDLPWDVRVGICGSAGTGKTVCALHRVVALASSGRAVALVCPNDDALMVSKQHLGRMLQGTNVDAYFLVPHAPNELAQIVGGVDHAVIDEGQEIPPTWYQFLNRAETRRSGLTIFFDLNQLSAQIPAGYTRKFHERKESWDSAVLRQLGCIALSLHVNYRNSREISECYFHLLKESLLSPITAEVPVFSAGPVIRKAVTSASAVPTAVFQIVRQLRKTYADGEIGIVSSTSVKALDGVSEVLKSAGVSVHGDPNRSDGVLVATAIKVRGYRGFENEIEAGIQWLIDHRQDASAAAYRRKFANFV